MSPDSGTSSSATGPPCSAADVIVPEVKWPAEAMIEDHREELSAYQR